MVDDWLGIGLTETDPGLGERRRRRLPGPVHPFRVEGGELRHPARDVTACGVEALALGDGVEDPEVGRRIGAAAVGNYTIITNGAEATDLTDDFSGPNDGIDVFWVQSVLNAGGFSNSDGPCDKDEKDERTGAVLEVSGSRRFTGVLLAHEVGHYLGLGTGPGIGNLMGTDPDGDGIDSINSNSTAITNAQANTMRSGCWVRAAC